MDEKIFSTESQKNTGKAYYLGLDIGTDSVGYAATDEEYSLLRFHGEPMWGVSLFDEASLNTDRRAFRTGRRRIDRRQQRVRLLSELFAAEISKKDEKFFLRLKNSAIWPEDKEEPGSLFGPGDYTDADYHRDYPTVHHLIADLMRNPAPHDVRLVYLACAWLVAHRGHFLSEIETNNIDALTDFSSVWEGFLSVLREECDVLPWKEEAADREGLKEALAKRSTVTEKYRSVCRLLFGESKPPKELPEAPFQIDLLLKLLCGSQVDPAKLFPGEDYGEIGSFRLDSDEETLAKVLTQLGENAPIVEKAKAVFDWSLLCDSLSGYPSISEAKVALYERHKKDLAFLKAFIRKYLPEKYREVFRDVRKDNYTAYSLHCKKEAQKKELKRANKEDFSKYLLGLIQKVTPEEKDRAGWEDMKARLETRSFLPKQRDTDNRVIPHQIYEKELTDLLKVAERYLPFLSKKDGEGLTVSEKILAVFSFRIPYFVGPLNRGSERAWVKFFPGESGPVLPWNFYQKIDGDASEQEFIRKMTNTCTYLPGEDVLPKSSLLYSSYTVLNEINNLRLDGEKLPTELKQRIYNEVFLRRRKVTKKRLEDFLLSTNAMQKGQELTGVDATLTSSLSPWLDFRRLLESGTLTYEEAEKIILRKSYSEDKNRFVKWLKREFPSLPDEDVRYLSGLSCKDFGRLSRAFLTGLPGVDRQAGTGEALSVMQALWTTDYNLMELLSDRFTFREAVAEESAAYYSSHPQGLSERMEEMYLSNSVKRQVFRTLAIVKEVAHAVGNPPAKIFVEMTRGGSEEQRGKRTVSRKEQLLELYKKCDAEEVRLLTQELESMGEEADSRLQSEALYLYYTQLGKCMYTGQPLDLARLKEGLYNRDHIWPQALVKDDSILNNLVLVLSENNGQKKDTYPIDSAVRERMTGFWKHLRDVGLITEEKYRRLTRATPFTEEERLGFINRQLTETSQSTKAVATLLKGLYPDAEIVYVKARLTSEFRQEFELFKSRTYNDLHHAKDAYLNIVTGNVYHMRFSKLWFSVNDPYSVKTKSLFTHPVICRGKTVWDGTKMLEKVKTTVGKNNARMVRYSFCREGGLFDQQPVKKGPGLIPRKAGLPTEKYGGYNKPTVSFFALTKYRAGNKCDCMVMPVELLFRDRFLAGGEAAEEYAKKRIGQIIGKTVDEVSFPLGKRILKVNTMLSLDGFRICIAGSAGGGRCLIAAPFVPFAADRRIETYLKRLEVMTEKAKGPHFVYHAEYDKVTKEENLALYDLYLSKLSKSIYAKRPNNPLKTVEAGREKFIALSPVEQAQALLNLHAVFGRISSGCDLTLIGGAAHTAATVNFSSTLSNWKKYYHDVRIIDPSSSGLWEKVSDNLLSLL